MKFIVNLIVVVTFLTNCVINSDNQEESILNTTDIKEENTSDTLVLQHFFDSLSTTDNIDLQFVEITKNNEFIEHFWMIRIFSKKGEIRDTIQQKAFVFHPENVDFNKCRSFETNVNTDQDVCDNDFGNFVIADFNFDNKFDFAIQNDNGGNGGVFYSFYLKNSEGNYQLDNYLTDSVVYFPYEINQEQKRLKNTCSCRSFRNW